MASNVWVYDINSKSWSEAKIHSNSSPASRGWFIVDVLKKSTEDRIVMQGGLGETNKRLGNL
jgi:hypothetical protein